MIARGPKRLAMGAAVLCVLGAFSGYQVFLVGKRPTPAPATRFEPLLAPRVVTVTPGVHMLGHLLPSAVYVVELTDGLLLIDAGLDTEHELLCQGLADLGLDVTKIRAILLTHAHGDHTLGAMPLRLKSGAKIYAGKADARALREGGPWTAIFSKFDMPEVVVHPTDVDVELSGGETLDFGETIVKVLATPGHTPGSVCYLVHRDGQQMLFAGDTLMSLSGGTGTYSAYLSPQYRGDSQAYLRSLRALRELPAPDLLLPGHPREDRVPQSPRLTLGQWRQMLDRGIRELETLNHRYRTDGADFLDGRPKEILPGLHYLGDLEDCAAYLLDTGSQLLLLDAPGGPGLPAWLESRLRERGLSERPLTAVLLTSCSDEALAGLPALVEATGCGVVCSAAGIDQVGRRCPDAQPIKADELTRTGWLDAKVVPLADLHPAAVAYQFSWHGKQVLASGRMPIQGSQAEHQALEKAFDGSASAARAYRQSLQALLTLKPDIWLPAIPVHGINANLYDSQWRRIISFNLMQLPGVSHSIKP